VNRSSRVAAIVLVLGSVLLGSPAPASAATPVAAVAVTLTTATSGDVGAGQPLRTLVTIDNPTAAETPAATATLSVDPVPFASRAALADWFSGESKITISSRKVAHAAVPAVTSQLSGAVGIDAPASALGFRTAGVYGVSVTVTSGLSVLGTSRTAVAWNTGAVRAVPVAIAVPMTVPAGNSEFLSAAQLAQYTGPNGILTDELADVQDSQIAIGIDPRVIASIRVLGNTAPTTATAWLNTLKALPNETFPLAWADADLTAPLQAGAAAVLEPKSLAYAINPNLFPAGSDSTPSPTPTPGSGGSTVPTPAGLVAWNYTMPALQWPAADSVEPADLAKLNEAGITSAILTTKNIDDPDVGGLEGASGKSASTTIAVSDDVMSGYLRDAVQATTRVGSVASVTELTTTLALIGLKSAGSPRTVLLTLGRNWASAGANFARGVDELYARPWASSAVLSSVFSESPRRLTLDKDAESPERISLVSDMMSAEARVVPFSAIAANPLAITSSYRLQLLSMLSDEWLDTPAAWQRAAQAYVTRSDKVVASVQVSRSGRALALADQVALPISISNGLDQAVTVTLSVRSTTTLVSINPQYQSQSITIDAGSQKRVQIPIEALSNGNARLIVTLQSATGLSVGQPVTLRVNVQAGWESVGTLIFVALIVALFAFGIIRRFRKRRVEDVEGVDTPAPGAGPNE
jgi:hypothetical protein